MIGLNALFITAGFSGFELLPVYAKNEAAVSETQIGIVFLVNTIVIVLLQLPIARFAQGRRRMPALGAARAHVGGRVARRAASPDRGTAATATLSSSAR